MHVTLAVAKNSALPENVSVVSGTAKATWAAIDTGDSVTTVLASDGEAVLQLQFDMGHQHHYWEGPELPKGVGHRIRVRIAADGSVSEQHCTVPCQLPPEP